jgi:hypothetical protein
MNTRYIKEAEWLPEPPASLVDDLESIPSIRQNRHHDITYSHIYASYTTSPELEQFYQDLFDYEIACRYQVIGGKLRPHVDVGIHDGWKYNYLFTTGGAVTTSWWSSDQELDPFGYPGTGPELLYEIECEPNKWYSLNVHDPHAISQPQTTRYSLVIRKK